MLPVATLLGRGYDGAVAFLFSGGNSMEQKRRLMPFLFVQAITLGRVPLVLFFSGATLLADTRHSMLWFSLAFWSLVLAALTDLFDGYLARKLDVVSRLGAFADPLTDKIFYAVTFPTLVYLAVFPRPGGDPEIASIHARFLLVLAILFLLRDQWVSFLRSMGAIHNISARANWSGKARTVISFPTVCIIYYYLEAPEGYLWDLLPFYRWPALIYALECLCLGINLVSLWVYTVAYWPALQKEAGFPGK
jgi:CDP-diacylglycerol--glycerol-3-phosphate 3-phosphatidyltransferase